MNCWPCKYPATDPEKQYDRISYALFKSYGQLCPACEAKMNALPKEPIKFILKAGPKQFVPPIPKEPIKNYQDREPGSDDE